MAALAPIQRSAAVASSSTPQSLAGMPGRCSTSSPIRQLFHLHEAIRQEVDRLHEAAIALEKGEGLDEDIAKLHHRHQFLYSVYKHHSNAEDEVILPALDLRVKNVAFAYALEHEASSFLFQTLANVLESVIRKTGEERAELLREIACMVEALKRSLHQHLYKEEEQVLPLLMKHLSFEEQADLVWQFMCCIPLSLLEEVIPWVAGCLTWEERQEMVAHMRDMIPPQELLLQQVVSTWMMRRGTPPDLAIRWKELTSKEEDINTTVLPPSSSPSPPPSAAPSPSSSPSQLSCSGWRTGGGLYTATAEEGKPQCGVRSEIRESQWLPLVDDDISMVPQQRGEGGKRVMISLCSSASPDAMDLIEDNGRTAQAVLGTDLSSGGTRDQDSGSSKRAAADPGNGKEKNVNDGRNQKLDDDDGKQNLKLYGGENQKLEDDGDGGKQKDCNGGNGYFVNEGGGKDDSGERGKMASPFMENQRVQTVVVGTAGARWPSGNREEDNYRTGEVAAEFSKGGEEKLNDGARKDNEGGEKSGKTSIRFPINEMIHFHNALRVELERFAEEAKTMQLSGSVCKTALSALNERFRFLADVCFFHTTAEEEVVFPAVGKKFKLPVTYTEDHANEERLLTDVGRLIAGMQTESKNSCTEEDVAQRMVKELSLQAEAIVTKVCQHFIKEESLVLPLVCEHFSMEEQREIMYQSLRAMPLRLLERVLPWVVALLSDEETSDMLRNMQLAAPEIDSALVELFSGWASRGRSRLCPGSPPSGNVSNSPLRHALEDHALTSRSEEGSGQAFQRIGGVAGAPSLSSGQAQIDEEGALDSERPSKRQCRVVEGVVYPDLSVLPGSIPSLGGTARESQRTGGPHHAADTLSRRVEGMAVEMVAGLNVDVASKELEVGNSSGVRMTDAGTAASSCDMDAQEISASRGCLSKRFDENVMGVGHSRRTTGRGVLKDRVHRRKAARLKYPKKPIDHIFQFHKAIRKDLEYLDYASTKLVDCDDEALRIFSGRFHFMWGLYRAHSNAEDQIVFPALEAKEALHNVSHSYILDHRQEEQLFKDIAQVLEELLRVMVARKEYEKRKEMEGDEGTQTTIEGLPERDYYVTKHQALATRAQGMCKSVRISLDTHISSEEVELWPLFSIHFSEEEQDKIVGRIIGSTGAEVLQVMLPWVTTALTEEEQEEMMSFFRQATRNTMFSEWLRAWWKDEGKRSEDTPQPSPMLPPPPKGVSPPVGCVDSLAAVARYLTGSKRKKDGGRGKVKKRRAAVVECQSRDGQGTTNHVDHQQPGNGQPRQNEQVSFPGETADEDRRGDTHSINDQSRQMADGSATMVAGKRQQEQEGEVVYMEEEEEEEGGEEDTEEEIEYAEGDAFNPGWEQIFRMNQKELESAIRNVYSDNNLEPQRKAYLVQNLMTSRWIVAQQKMPHSRLMTDHRGTTFGGEPQDEDPANWSDIGRSRSYHDEANLIYGCEHYRRNCKLKAACCGQLFTCRFCHDNASDHTMDRHATKEMMCMECLEIQPVAQCCATPSCSGRQMARYYCDICKFFDDDVRDIYHCPFCNLCRVGKGLGIDFFHCMKCNACMSVSLTVHTCREKGLESDCPICHDFLFTSNTPVRSMPCGHFMHSSCYREYTNSHYTCPICCKSMGDMAVYFSMLDALLEAEVLPEEYRSTTQEILCNDCGKKGKAGFHFVYHKCQHCSSYNTRTI